MCGVSLYLRGSAKENRSVLTEKRKPRFPLQPACVVPDLKKGTFFLEMLGYRPNCTRVFRKEACSCLDMIRMKIWPFHHNLMKSF